MTTNAWGYFDTSALMRWVESTATPPRPINALLGPLVEHLLLDPTVELAISEVTLMEYRSVVTKNLRSPAAQDRHYDLPWASGARKLLQGLLASGRVTVLPSAPGLADRAISIVDRAFEKHGISVGVWDACHLITATAWANDLGRQVRLFTSDDDYDELVVHYPAFASRVQVIDLTGYAGVAAASL